MTGPSVGRSHGCREKDEEAGARGVSGRSAGRDVARVSKEHLRGEG